MEVEAGPLYLLLLNFPTYNQKIIFTDKIQSKSYLKIFQTKCIRFLLFSRSFIFIKTNDKKFCNQCGWIQNPDETKSPDPVFVFRNSVQDTNIQQICT